MFLFDILHKNLRIPCKINFKLYTIVYYKEKIQSLVSKLWDFFMFFSWDVTMQLLYREGCTIRSWAQLLIINFVHSYFFFLAICFYFYKLNAETECHVLVSSLSKRPNVGKYRLS